MTLGTSCCAPPGDVRPSRVGPNYAFPWVVKGAMSARQGRFADAVEMWEKARRIEPSYPNIDQLIGDADKRKELQPFLSCAIRPLACAASAEFGSTAMTFSMISSAPVISAFCSLARPILKSGLPHVASMSTARW